MTAVKALLARPVLTTAEMAEAIAGIPAITWGRGEESDVDDIAETLFNADRPLGELFLSQSVLIQRLVREERGGDALLAKNLLASFFRDYYGSRGSLSNESRFAPSGEVVAKLRQKLRGRHWRLDPEPIGEVSQTPAGDIPIRVPGIFSDVNTSRNVYPAPTSEPLSEWQVFRKWWRSLRHQKPIQATLPQNIALITHQGSRDSQEDYALAFEGRLPNGAKIKIAVVADGNGLIGGGRMASHSAAQIFLTRLLSHLSLDPLPPLRAAIRESIKYAQSKMAYIPFDGGTTFVAYLEVGAEKYIVNVGDSRAYFLSPSGEYDQISIDHMLRGSTSFLRVLRGGKAMPEWVVKAAGVRSEPDLFVPVTQSGGLVYLFSDGVNPTFGKPVPGVDPNRPLQQIAETILDLMFLTKDSYDNMTIGIVRVE